MHSESEIDAAVIELFVEASEADAMLAALRPRTSIIAATGQVRVAGTLALLRGVTPVITPERDVERLERFLLERRLVTSGAMTVFISVSPDLTRVDANFLNVQRVT